jgi:hypothetical protein
MKKPIIFLGLLSCLLFVITGASDSKIETLSEKLFKVVADNSDWSDPVNIWRSGEYCVEPEVAADEIGNVHVVFVVGQGGGRTVYYNNTDENGNWRSPQNVRGDGVNIGEGPWAEIQVDRDGAPNVVFSGKIGGNYEAVLNRNINGQWSGPINVSRTIRGGSAYPNLVIDPNTNDQFIFWQDDEFRENEEQIYWQTLVRFQDGGQGPWKGGGVVPDPNNRAYSPQGGIDEKGKIYLIWANRGAGNKTRVFFSENPNPKDWNTWSNAIDISGGTGISFAYPQIAVDWKGNCYVVWMDTRDGGVEVFFRKRVDGKWSTVENLSNSEIYSVSPTVAVNKETQEIYVAWEENTKILLREYSSGNWKDTVIMNGAQSMAVHPHIFVSLTGSVHLVFTDKRTGQWNIFHCFKQGRPPEPPVAPTGPIVQSSLDQSTTPNTKTNTVKWKETPEHADIPLESFNLYRKVQGQNDNQYNLLATLPVTTFKYDDMGLPTNIKYVYALSVTDSFEQESELSAAAGENAVYPPMDLGLETKINRVLFSQEKINYLSWGHNPLNDPVPSLSYNIYRKLTTEDNSQLVHIYTADANTFFYMDRGLSFTDKYIYSITVSDTEGHETPKLKAVIGEEEDEE